MLAEVKKSQLSVMFIVGEIVAQEGRSNRDRRDHLRLANIGYAFAEVGPDSTIDRDKRIVAITIQVNPARASYVRRISFKGNTRTQTQVLRREMRQFEGGWYSQAAIDRPRAPVAPGLLRGSGSRERPVAGSDDQVDVVYTVKEDDLGSIAAGVGLFPVRPRRGTFSCCSCRRRTSSAPATGVDLAGHPQHLPEALRLLLL